MQLDVPTVPSDDVSNDVHGMEHEAGNPPLLLDPDCGIDFEDALPELLQDAHVVERQHQLNPDTEMMDQLMDSLQVSKKRDEQQAVVAVNLRWFGVTVVAHTLAGGIPVCSRYLQTVSHLPMFSVGAVSMTVNALCFLAILLLTGNIDASTVRGRGFWGYSVAVLFRIITFTASAAYSPAYLVQIVELTTPFIIAVLSRVWHREHVSRATLIAMVGTGTGGVIVVAGSLDQGGFSPIGFGLSVVSVFFQSLGMILVKRVDLTPTQLLFSGNLCGMLLLVGSIAKGEDWGTWLRLSPGGIVTVLVFLSLLGQLAPLMLTMAVKKISATNVSSVMAVRLVSSVFAGWWVLGESPTSGFQFIGMGVVLFAVTGYVLYQRRRDQWRKNALGKRT